MVKRKNISTHSYFGPRHKEPTRVPIDNDVRWTPKPVWTRWTTANILPLPGVGPWNDVVTNAPSKLLYTCTAVQLNMITGLVTITTQLEIYNNYMLSAQFACRPGASSSYNVGKELTEII